LAAREAIEISHHAFAHPILALYFAASDVPPQIGLHTCLSSHLRLLRCVLAEELGHHFTSVGDHVATPYQSYMGKVLLGRTEKRALLWAGQALMPEAGVIRQVRQGAGVEGLADEFYVTPTFVRALLQLPQYVEGLGQLYTQGGLSRMEGYLRVWEGSQ